MHDVERTEYGLELQISGYMDESEMNEFCSETRRRIDRQIGEFCVFADHRGLKALPDEAAAELADLMAYAARNGLRRSAAVCDSATTTLQTQRLAEKARNGEHSVFIDADEVTDPHHAALEWFENGRRP
ncbi:MAG: hypothetical protein ABEH56_07000 [Salinirussus sp.]